jgi:hypothetical protein
MAVFWIPALVAARLLVTSGPFSSSPPGAQATPPSTAQTTSPKKEPGAPGAQTPTAPPGQSPATPAGQTPPAPADDPNAKPPVSGGTPTITDAAEMSAPGWVEFDPGVLKDLVQDPNGGSPFTLKFTAKNNRLQYLLGSDGLVSVDSKVTGIGDTYPGIHYLLRTQEHGGYDIALKGILKIPTASAEAGGTGKVDYSGYLLVSRDMTKWGFHTDLNAGVLSLGNAGMPGYSEQALLAASTTAPIKGGRWQYTNELVYFSGIQGTEARLTTMHGFAYSAHAYEVYSIALQVRLVGDIPRYQLLLAASFNLCKL